MKYYKREVIFSHNLKNPVIRIEAAICPYCNNNLKKIPQRKTKCPQCSKIIYIRTNANGEHFAATESQKNEIDKFQKRIKNTSGCIGCIFPILSIFSIILFCFFLIVIENVLNIY